MKIINVVIYVAAAATAAAQQQVALPQIPDRREQDVQNFPSGFIPKSPNKFIPRIDTVFDKQIPGIDADDEIFVSEYVAITFSDPESPSFQAIGAVFPANLALIGARLQSTGGSPVFFKKVSRPLLGTTFYTSSVLFNSVNVSDIGDENPNMMDGFGPPVGKREIVDAEPANPLPGFTFNGQCTVVSDRVKPGPIANPNDKTLFAEIDAQTCLFDMCFGEPNNCLLLYSGTPFIFDIHSDDLPPDIPAFVVGGTGDLEGIKGSADIITITSRSPLGDFSVDEIIGNVTSFPNSFTQQPLPTQVGDITQKIFLKTNKKLPSVQGSD